MKVSRLVVVVYFMVVAGCREAAVGPAVPAPPPSPDAPVVRVLAHYDPMYKVDSHGRVTDLRLDWRHLPRAVLAQVATLTQLRAIELSGSTITDDSLAELRALPNLRALSVVHTAITDRGLAHLEAFPALENVWVPKRNLTTEAIDKLKEARPDLHVHPL